MVIWDFQHTRNSKMDTKGQGGVIGAGIALVVLLVVTVIVGSVENSTTWTQTLSGTIGAYIEPLAMLSGLALAGGLAYKATSNFRSGGGGRRRSVSYTHLTLPTILLV